jgi:hypothetical protein
MHACLPNSSLVETGLRLYLLVVNQKATKGTETMMNSFQRLAKALRPRSSSELEYDYLCGAQSREDLEMRQREIDRGRFRR